ncbi:MAG: hypothetical protein J6S96_04005 [Muribaculaceae bacterium]|nr:hypothetical protein [Muribaculaceae bacterium]
MIKKSIIALIAVGGLIVTSCSDNDGNGSSPDPSDVTMPEDYYTGGELGTTSNTTASAYEQFTAAIENQGLVASFKRGERIFESPFDISSDETTPMRGLGPLWIRESCIACHPGYGHGARQNSYNSNTIGNGYLLVLTDENDTYLSSLTGMPQTQAAPPFKAPLDEKKIQINWLSYTDEWNNRFDDGETYSLIYPEVTIPLDAFYVPLQVGGKDMDYSRLRVRLENTIGLYGTGLLDAIDDADIRAQYMAEEKAGVSLNPAIWNNGDFSSYYTNTLQGDGTKYVRRFTYALSRGSIQDGPGANAIWNITNVTRGDRRYHYMTAAYASVASKDPDVQALFYKYYPQWNKTGNVEVDIYNYLMSNELPAEMTDDEYIDLMAWHRGLAVPAARDVNSADFQRGKTIFTELGCAYCHRPSWTTGKDEIRDPNNFFVGNRSKLLPRYPNQKIWPYTDMIQHRLFMKNDIRTGWCRTTPLWGRGLSAKCTGASERLHDCRARTVIEAIMWHGSTNSDARKSVENFRKLNKSDRDAVVKFIESI